MTYCAGLDVSLRSTHICAIDDDGELLAEGKAVFAKCIDLEQEIRGLFLASNGHAP